MATLTDVNHREIIEGLFKIANKEAEAVPFIFNEVQSEYYEHRTNRDIILKARQMGFSSLILALFLVDCIYYDNINAVVISHEKGATQRLFQRVKFYIDHLPEGIKVNLETASKNEFYFSDTGSRFFIGTAGAKAFGHGETIQRLHISELSRWDNPSLLMGLLQAIPKTDSSWVVIESTANGTGNDYYQRWMNSKGKDNPYTGHFYPWTMFHEYQTPAQPDFSPLPEEQELIKQGLTLPQIVWRREKIEEFTRDERGVDPVDFFKEQYPMNEIEAFVSTSTTAFSLTALRSYGIQDELGRVTYEDGKRGKIYSTGGGMAFEPDNSGWLTIYRKPELGKKYSIGADVASGSERGNYSTAVVFCNDDLSQVAEFRSKVDTDVFAEELTKLAKYYNQAFLGVESNNQGLAVLKALDYKNLYYRQSVDGGKSVPKMGWETNSKTRPLMIDYMASLIREHDVILRSEMMIMECMSFVKNSKGRYEAAEGSHDDLVMACAIALQMYHHKPVTGESEQEKQKKDAERKKDRKQRHISRDPFASVYI